jgi:hypothetical protein
MDLMTQGYWSCMFLARWISPSMLIAAAHSMNWISGGSENMLVVVKVMLSSITTSGGKVRSSRYMQ